MSKTTIIAEAGVNHNGSLNMAKCLADAAKDIGADIVKFQTANLSSLVTKSAKMADYQISNLHSETSQYDMLKKITLSYENFEELADYCRMIGIKFLSTPFDIESIEFLKKFKMNLWKIPSGEITNLPYLEAIAKTGDEIIISTGMSTMDEVDDAIKILTDNGCGEITILHCTTEYPAEIKDVNLKAMITLRDKFGFKVGYSDHTCGITIPIAAVAMGASVIEKHITLDKNMEGPDHKASMEPEEFRQMVKAIRELEIALGDGKKKPSETEIKNRIAARKSIVAKRKIRNGELFTEENITTKRPGNGISPMLWKEVIGTISKRDYYKDDMIII